MHLHTSYYITVLFAVTIRSEDYDHDKLVKQIREANHAFLKKRGWLQITVG